MKSKKTEQSILEVFSDKNPFGYVDENGEYQGYDVYLRTESVKISV